MIRSISVIGGGTMGHGIAQVFALHGYPVSLYESFDGVRNTVMAQMAGELGFLAEEGYIPREAVRAALDNITLFGELGPAVEHADFVIEAIPEDLALKQALFTRLDALCPAHTILASNTSSLPLGEMTGHLPEGRQSRAMVCHWYNPAHLIPIAELSCFGNMDEALFEQVYQLHQSAGKQPIRVQKDVPGLVANRILHAMAREVFHLMEAGVASPEDIDKALKFGPGFRSATTGILEVADMGGLDVWCAVEDNLFKELNNADKAADLLREKVRQGNLGLKTGAGFFEYPADGREAVKKAFERRLLTQLKASKHYQ